MSDPKRIDLLADGTARICEHVPVTTFQPDFGLTNDVAVGGCNMAGSWRVVDGQIAPPEGVAIASHQPIVGHGFGI